MTISISDAGKRYNRDWIFRHFTHQFHAGSSYAITGPNGSGKSTLLQAIGGAVGLNEGKLEYRLTVDRWSLAAGNATPLSQKPDNGQRTTDNDNLYQHISLVAPYLEVVEEMTVTEFLSFHGTFKPLLSSLSIKDIISAVGLSSAAHKQIRYYSSGMKQRAKLAQAIFSDVPVVLLDEPCTNLDATGIALYQQLVRDYCADRLVIVSSNDEAEYGFCREKIDITAFK
ncbi:MAG: ATP-binding cassette domain-containing protein [Bacteroidetes bacterium]|nr:ATP-binding cassette domain-containing protein [Bacteroidota bacterium]